MAVPFSVVAFREEAKDEPAAATLLESLQEARVNADPIHSRILESLSEQIGKRERMLRRLWTLPNLAVDSNGLDLLSLDKEFTAFLNQPRCSSTTSSKVAELGRLESTCALVMAGRRYKMRMEQLKDRLNRDSLAMVEFDDWTQKHDDEGNQYYQNGEGLSRLDAPASWMSEEMDRDRRVEESQDSMIDVEDFVSRRVFALLDEVNHDLQQCRLLLGTLEQENEGSSPSAALSIVRRLVQVQEMVLSYLGWEAPLLIPGIPSFGVTNAYNHRRQRSRPNFRAELEDFFDQEYN